MTTKANNKPDPSLQAQLDASREWFESGGSQGQVLSIDLEEYPGLDLSNAVLVEAHMRETVLVGSDLRSAKAMGIDGPGLSCDGVLAEQSDWSKAELTESSFRGAAMRGAVFRRAHLTRACFAGADLTGVDLFAAQCFGTDLTGAQLTGADCSTAILSSASLAGACLDHVRFDRTVVDEKTMLRGARGLATATIVSLTTPEGRLDGWNAASWLVRQAIVEAPSVAFQAYLLAQMSNLERVAVACGAIGIAPERVPELHELLARIFDVPGHTAEEYERWLGPPVEQRSIDAAGEYSGSTRACWRLPAFPHARFGVSRHPSGYAWDMRFEAGEQLEQLEPWAATIDGLSEKAAHFEELEHWPPRRDVILAMADGRRFEARFEFDLLQELRPVAEDQPSRESA